MPKVTARPDDELVMETMLLDFLHDNGKELSSEIRGHDYVILGRHSPDNGGFVMPDQVNVYLHKDHQLPDELVQALYNRNKGAKEYSAVVVDYGRFKFDKRIHVSDKLPDILEIDHKAKGWFECWAPAYSNDHRTAVVRASIGPEEHGAIVTYLLLRTADSWRVKWREFAFFT